MSFLRAEIIAVGSELLGPDRPETNSLFLAGCLEGIGARVVRKWVVGDREAEIVRALEIALEAGADIVLLSGGLGPTTDDLTREAVSSAWGLELKTDPALVERLKRHVARLRIELPENNLRQTLVPEGAQVLPNPLGTAPGLFLRRGEALVFLLPGPPRELEPMVEAKVLPLIRSLKPIRQRYQRILKIAAFSESHLDARIEKIYRACPTVEVTILSSPGIIDVRLTWTGPDERRTALGALDDLETAIKAELGPAVYATEDKALEQVTGEALRQAGLTLATAESCSGGWIGKLLTDVAGSSDYYLGGVVAYSNALKVSSLGVNELTLQKFGAVSPQVAQQMARGVRLTAGADIGLSVTGIAGPDGGSPDKPVGLVYLGLSIGDSTRSRRLRLPGDREGIRLRAARLALDWVRRSLL